MAPLMVRGMSQLRPDLYRLHLTIRKLGGQGFVLRPGECQPGAAASLYVLAMIRCQ